MFCNETEEFLRKDSVDFSVRDIKSDSEAFAELERLGTMTAPVTLVNGEAIVGFDRERLRREIGF